MTSKGPRRRRSSAAPSPNGRRDRRSGRAGPPELSREEVVELESQAARYQSCEKAWQSLSSAGEEDDRWSPVEEHLLARAQGRDHASRRWKYFSK